MALFRKFFYKKPPDGLLEISERVYVFDCCFSTDVLEEDDYKVYIGGIVEQLREHFPDASFMVFNFREGERESQIASILSEYDMTVMDYPRHYEGCPLLKMEMIHHFLRSSESWLSLGPHNILLMHCERGGWPVLAFMLAALLIYRKQYTGEQKTLDMIYKQAPRELLHLLSPLDPVPSQLRYLQYVSRRNVASEWPPCDRALTLDCIMLRMIPNFDGEGGCRPIFRIYGQDPFIASDRTTKVLFSTPKKNKCVRHYRQTDCELVKIDIHCHIQGDVVLECISLDDDLQREEMMFRVMFNTAFIRSNILMVNRDQIDILWDAKDRFPKDFRAEVLLSEMDAASSVITMELTSGEEKEGLPIEAFAKVQEIFSNVDWLDAKGDAAFHVLQQLTSSNSFQEKSNAVSPLKVETHGMPQQPSPLKLTEKADYDAIINNAVSDVNMMPPSLMSYSNSAASGLTEPAEKNISIGLPSSPLSFSASSNQKISVIPPPPPPPPLATTPSASTTILPSRSTPPTTTPPPPPPPLIQQSIMPSPRLSSPPPPEHLPPSKPVTTIPLPPPPPFLGASSTHQRASNNTSTKLSSTPPVPPPPPPPLPTSSTPRPPAPPIKKPGGPVGAPPPPPPPPSHPGTGLPMASPAAPPPPPPPQFAPKQSTVSTSPKPSPVPPVPPPPMSSQGSLKSAQASSMGSKGTGSEFVSPPAAPHSSSLGVKGRILTRAKSPRSLHSTQSSSKRTSLKPLHWVKVTRAMQGSLWAEAQKSDEASKAPEIDMSELESLFSAVVPNSDSLSSERSRRRSSLGAKPDKVHLIDLRRANNCEIMLTKVKIPLPDLMSSLLALDDSVLDVDQVDNLIKFCPTKEEMDLLKGYNGDKASLGKCEQFFLELMKVPRVEAKLRVFSFKIQFRSQVADLRSSLNIINSAAEEIRNSMKLKRIMQTILSLGNALNQGTARGSAIGFRLDSLLKLTDTRARNNKLTLMHYLCKVLADKLPEVLDFDKDLVSLEAASKIQLKILAEEMQAISKGLEKVEQELTSSENDGPVSAAFQKTLKEFLVVAEAEVRSLTSLYSGVGRNADALALYFGEDPARCPFEQVVSTLLNFTKMFGRAHEENCKQLDLEKKKAQKEMDNEKLKLAPQKRETENALRPPIRSGETQ